jgi:hypothetical protein
MKTLKSRQEELLLLMMSLGAVNDPVDGDDSDAEDEDGTAFNEIHQVWLFFFVIIVIHLL